MSKFKVGDRVRVRIPGEVFDGTVCITPKQGDIAYYVRDSDGNEWACMPDGISRLVKRKRAKVAAPDRVMVAAQLMAGMLANPGGPIQVNASSGWSLCNTTIAEVAVIAFELADALIAEGAK